MTQVVDNDALLTALKKLVQEEPAAVKAILQKVYTDAEGEVDGEFAEIHKADKRSKLERIVEEDFAEYSEVFKALA